MTATAAARSGRRAAFLRVARATQMRRALLAYFAFSSVEWAIWIVVLVWAHSVGTAATVGFVAVVQLVPAALLAPSLASLVDRLPRSTAPAFTYATLSVAVGMTGWAMLVDAPFAVVLTLAVVANTLVGAGRPAHHSLTPCLAAGPTDLVAANVVATGAEGLGLFAGPALVGVLMAASSPGVAMVACVAVLAGAALLTSGFPPVHLPDVGEGHEVEAGLIVGLRRLRSDGASRLPILLGGVQGFVEGAVDVLIVLLAIEVLGMGDGGAGYLNAVLGVGAIVGGVASSALVGRLRLAPPMLVSGLLTGVAMVLVAFAPAAALFLALLGIGYALTSVITKTMLQRLSPMGVMGRMFGLLEGVSLAGLALGAAAAPLVTEAVGVEPAFAVFGLAMPLMLFASWRSLTGADRRSTVPTAMIEVLRRVEAVSGMEPEALEALARGARPVTATAGQAIVREGEPGHEMYVIEAGAVEVSRAGTVVATLGASDLFGEIALMSDAPRIATVTATEPTSLLAISREAFLGALSTDPAAHLALEHLAHSRRRETLGDA